ncbi:MAG: ARMT1-like domain-containing protein [Bacillota bacterium]|nr:ARMT1-like domain-containing protein [Bacillota bacterium]
MKVSAECMHCLVKRQAENIKKYPDEEKKAEYLGKVLGIIAEGAAEEPAPVLLSYIGRLHEEYFGKPFSFEELKKGYNAMMLEKEAEIRSRIGKATDPLALALRFAQIGNFIDFGAMDSVDDAKLIEFLEQAETLPLSEDTYKKLTKNLQTAGKLVYMTDNCGEIVLDKLLLETIGAKYPAIERTIIVRGEPVLNDATMEDALQVGIGACGRVIPNGTNIAGTYLPWLSAEAKQAMAEADILLSKGQGNFESLHGCGLNIYYLFLCKCQWFMERFGLPQYSGVFINEKDL